MHYFNSALIFPIIRYIGNYRCTVPSQSWIYQLAHLQEAANAKFSWMAIGTTFVPGPLSQD